MQHRRAGAPAPDAVARIVVLHADDLEGVDRVRQSLTFEHRTGGDMEVQMGAGGVAGVADVPEHVAATYALPFLHADAGLQMAVRRVRAVGEPERDAV